jgi:predicted site-specific integrase-resolvase
MNGWTSRQAAQVLGISSVVLQRQIRTVKTACGHHRVPESQVDRFLYRDSPRGELSERRANFRRISGRNQLVGRVTEIKIRGLMAK